MVTSPSPLTFLSADAHGLSVEAFIRRHGNAFFVHAGELEASGRPILRTLTDRDRVGGGSAASTMQVFSVRPKAGNVFPDFISIGRAPNNDIVIVHASVSKFHAFLRPQKEGFLLQDGGSSNGTFVDDKQVPVKGQGEPVMLFSGMNLRFGSLEVSYLDGEALRQLAQLLTAPPADAHNAHPAG